MMGVFTFLMVLGLFLIVNKKERAIEKLESQIPKQEWCFLKAIPFGGNFSEIKPGEYQYQLIVHEGGVQVFIPCDKI